MKAIVAIIKPHRLAYVTLALHKLEGISGMTVTEVRGFGTTRAQGSSEIVPDDVADFVRKTRVLWRAARRELSQDQPAS